ncbi:GrpB family protein [Enemella sp. A6]|uniref:GrpB family protein n=1 Tax=Enemella sp. A6 TaxID=3440152 RepID=UPI003EBD25BA
MPVEVVPYSESWPEQFELVAADLRRAVAGMTSALVEHVGSTSVPGLAAKPVIDIDIIVDSGEVPAAIAALEAIGYVHRGDLGIAGREAFFPPDENPKRNVYVCTDGSLNLRNHLAVRDVLRKRPDLRDEYGDVKLALAADPEMDIDTYLDAKSPTLQRILAEAEMSEDDRDQILRLNQQSFDRDDPDA